MNLEKIGVQELNAKELKNVEGGFWWFRLSLGNYLFNDLPIQQQELAYA